MSALPSAGEVSAPGGSDAEQLSIVIPFYNEEANVEAVLEETRRTNPDAEIIAVDDGSTDFTASRIRAFPDVRLISLPRNLGQSAALYAGLVNARHDLCALMDGDGQHDPADIAVLLREADKFDVVCGYRVRRKDSWRIRIASWIANAVRRCCTGDGIRDAGCTLKLIRKEHIRFLVPFGELQCYIPAMLKHGGLKIGEVPVRHRPRQFGRSKYTILGRAWRGIWDLLGVCWLLRRQIHWPPSFPKAS